MGPWFSQVLRIMNRRKRWQEMGEGEKGDNLPIGPY